MLNQTEQVALDNFKSMGTMNREQVAEYFELLKKLEVKPVEETVEIKVNAPKRPYKK